MERFEQLVKALRYCKVDYCSSCLGCPMYADYEGSGCINEMHDSAAAAIEDLQAVLKEADKKQAYQHDCICELTSENEELKAEAKQLEPKRGEWKETDMGGDGDIAWVCSVCGEPWTLIYGTPKENNMNYCPNCGARMEVQDESAGSL